MPWWLKQACGAKKRFQFEEMQHFQKSRISMQ
jgi:hypothetical protein